MEALSFSLAFFNYESELYQAKKKALDQQKFPISESLDVLTNSDSRRCRRSEWFCFPFPSGRGFSSNYELPQGFLGMGQTYDHNLRIYVRLVVEQLPVMVSVLPAEVFLFSSPHKLISCTPLCRQQGEVRQVH